MNWEECEYISGIAKGVDGRPLKVGDDVSLSIRYEGRTRHGQYAYIGKVVGYVCTLNPIRYRVVVSDGSDNYMIGPNRLRQRNPEKDIPGLYTDRFIVTSDPTDDEYDRRRRELMLQK